MRLIFKLLSLLFWIVPAHAQPAPTGSDTLAYSRDLTRFCHSDRKSGEYAMCWSFIAAVLEVAKNNSIYGLKLCVPPLLNLQGAVDVTIKWLDENPDRDLQAASLAITEALATAFPCHN